MYYTMGQRQGLGIGGRRDHAEEPWYVVDKDLANNALIVAQGSEHPALLHRALGCGQLHWIGPPPRADTAAPARQDPLPPGRPGVHAARRTRRALARGIRRSRSVR